MATFRRQKYLTCFYCGRRTSTRYDAEVRHFDCPNCDATNYLDEHGDITDPPVATSEVESPSRQYALPRPSTTSSSRIFCETCLKNQHLFTSSLAQYLPDDPDHSEYAERERGYYKFRRGLEERYPQACNVCEPKVRDQIKQAGYTAKTDHLRRMLDRSRQVQTTSSPSLLNFFNTTGRLLWILGLVLQILWHVSIICDIVPAEGSLEDDGTWTQRTIRTVGLLFAVLPSSDRLIFYSIMATVLSIWWNPRLVQTVRGFTKHLVGLSYWYSYQVAIIILKVGTCKASTVPSSQEVETGVRIIAHVAMVIFMVFIHNHAIRSIKIDTTPLFGSTAAQKKEQQPQALPEPPAPREVAQKSMSDILDDILRESTSESSAAISRFSSSNTNARTGHPSTLRSSYNPTVAAITGNPFRQNNLQQPRTDISFDSLNLSEQIGSRSQQIDQSDDAMDWSPTQSKHRAFSTHGLGQQQNGGFGQTPANPQAGQFWYRVPPAPSTPAQRLFNPPNAPRIRTSPMVKEPVRFRGSTTAQTRSPARTESSPKKTDTIFAEPSFFAQPQSGDDEALSSLFDRSFSLNPSQEVERAQGRRRSSAGNLQPIPPSQPSYGQFVEMVVLVACLTGWLHATMSPYEYTIQLTVTILLVYVTISARINLNTLKKATNVKDAAIGTVLGIAEIAFAGQIALKMWGTSGGCADCHSQGGWLIGTMLAHQVWNLLL